MLVCSSSHLRRLAYASVTVLVFASCNDSSGSSLAGLGDEFDIAALSDAVQRLCGEAECSDYSQSECEFYLRYDSLVWARLTQKPDTCLSALTTELNCLAEAGSCHEESCYAPDDACELVTEVPEILVPEALAPTQTACEWLADCEVVRFDAERDFAIAECQADLVSRAEIFQHDRGPGCAQQFIDFIVCIGQADLSCDADGDDEDVACPAESTAYYETCFPG
ncbi:MAG: hypothetical protein WCE62_09975 [Polyangiales bacterium]